MRIYADSLKPNIPYKTILLSTSDMADLAVVEALEKYGLEKENPGEYCIARVPTPSRPYMPYTPHYQPYLPPLPTMCTPERAKTETGPFAPMATVSVCDRASGGRG